MSCPCCGDAVKWRALKDAMGYMDLSLNYCPVCSNHTAVGEFLRSIREFEICIPEKIKDENGKEITMFKEPGHSEVSSYGTVAFDLDNIDISRELKLLNMQEKDDEEHM